MYALACLRARSPMYVPMWKRRREKERVLIPPSPGAGTPSWPNFTPPSFHPPVVVCCIPICLIFFLPFLLSPGISFSLYLSISIYLLLFLSFCSFIFSLPRCVSIPFPSIHPSPTEPSPSPFLCIFSLQPIRYFLSVFMCATKQALKTV